MSTNWREFEDFAAAKFDEQTVSGMIVSVAKDGQPVYTKTFGYADVEEKQQIDEETIFGIGSVTKSFTALAVMQLDEQGKLSVDDKITKYIPEFRTIKEEWAEATTIHHFLTHTSGLPMYGSEMLVTADKMNPDELKGIQPMLDKYGFVRDIPDLVELIGKSSFSMLGEPGRYMSYSNDGYALLGAVIERASGMPYVEYMEKHLLSPLGMTRTTYRPDVLRKLDNVAQLYAYGEVDGKRAAVASPNWWYSDVHAPAGIFLNSCVRDMTRYLEVFRLGGTVDGVQIVTTASVNKILTRHIPVLQGTFYGYGMEIHPDFHGQILFEHGGGAKGVSSQVYILPESGYTAVAFSNVGGAPSGDILLGAMNVAVGQAAGSPMTASAADAPRDENLSRYGGRYANGENEAEVEVADGKLVMKGLGLEGELAPSMNGEFTLKVPGGPEIGGQFFFDDDAQGVANGVNFGARRFARV